MELSEIEDLVRGIKAGEVIESWIGNAWARLDGETLNLRSVFISIANEGHFRVALNQAEEIKLSIKCCDDAWYRFKNPNTERWSQAITAPALKGFIAYEYEGGQRSSLYIRNGMRAKFVVLEV